MYKMSNIVDQGLNFIQQTGAFLKQGRTLISVQGQIAQQLTKDCDEMYLHYRNRNLEEGIINFLIE